MKTLFLVFATSLVFALVLTLTATGATAKSKELCEVGSEIIHGIATMRDEGATREESKVFLAFTGMKPKHSRPFLDLVYGRGGDFSPEELKGAFFNFCMSQKT